MTRRVALYGGSFDPPHNAHVLIATWVLCLGYDEVRLVPVYEHAFGKKLAPFETRCAMVADAMRHLGARVIVERIEETLEGTSYTIDTVRALLAREPDLELTLVMGTDTWAQRAKWREWDALEALIGGRVVVLGRAGVPDPDDVKVDVHLPELSSTEIRRRVAAGEPYGWMVPEAVMRRIEAEGLYR